MNGLETLLPFGLTPEGLLVTMAAGAAFLLVIGVWYGLIERDPWQQRARAIAGRREELRGSLARERAGRRRRKNESLSAMRRVVDALKLMQSKQTTKLYDRCAQAGLRSRDTIVVVRRRSTARHCRSRCACWPRSSAINACSGPRRRRPACPPP
jgi:hypothetical protein